MLHADALCGAWNALLKTWANTIVRSGDWAPMGLWLLTWTLCGLQSDTEPKLKTKANVIDAEEPGASVELPEEASAASGEVKDAMHTTCALYSLDFQELEGLQKLKCR